jgi:hypothetical protein
MHHHCRPSQPEELTKLLWVSHVYLMPATALDLRHRSMVGPADLMLWKALQTLQQVLANKPAGPNNQ